MRRHRWVLVLTAVLTLALALPAGATKPTGVDIAVETSLLGDPSTFVASGPAVDDGLICSDGDIVDESGKVTGFSRNGFNFQGVKHFTCADGTGEFFVNLQARIDFRKGTTFRWNVLRGTGDYEDLHGAGRGVGLELCGENCVLDLYEGGLHVDP